MSTVPEFPGSGDAYQQTEYDVVPSQTDYSFSWPYLDQENYDGDNSPYVLVAHVTDSGTRTYPTFTMPTSSSIRLATAYQTGTLIIMRQSWPGGLVVDFARGATLSDESLDRVSKQLYYLWEEAVDISSNAYATNNDDAKFNAIFTYNGDGSTADFRLSDADYTIDELPSDIAVWVFVNGAFVQSADYTLMQDTDDVLVVSLERTPESGEYVEIRVAQFQALTAAISDGQIDCDMLASGAICSLLKFDLDGEASAYQVLGWENDSGTSFGAKTLDHNYISDFDAEVVAKRRDEFADPTSNLSMNNNKITDLTDPTAAQDAATKAYVDSNAGTTADIDSTSTGVTMSKEVARSNSGSTAMFVSAHVEIGVNGQDTVSLQIKPTASGSWETVATADVAAEAASNNQPDKTSVSFFVPVGYDYRWTGTWSQNVVTVTEQQFG